MAIIHGYYLWRSFMVFVLQIAFTLQTRDFTWAMCWWTIGILGLVVCVKLQTVNNLALIIRSVSIIFQSSYYILREAVKTMAKRSAFCSGWKAPVNNPKRSFSWNGSVIVCTVPWYNIGPLQSCEPNDWAITGSDIIPTYNNDVTAIAQSFGTQVWSLVGTFPNSYPNWQPTQSLIPN